MKRISLLLFMIASIPSLAQLKGYSVYLRTNYTPISDVTERQEITAISTPSTGFTSAWMNTGSLRESYTAKFGWETGGKFDYSISNRFFISSGLSVNYYRFKRKVKVEDTDAAQEKFVTFPGFGIQRLPMGIIKGTSTPRDQSGTVIVPPDGNTHIGILGDVHIGNTSTLHLQIPVLIGTSFLKNKLIVRSGFGFSYLLHARRYEQHYSSYPASVNARGIISPGTTVVPSEMFIDSSIDTSPVLLQKRKSSSGFTSFSANIMLQSTYMLTRRIGIDVAAQRSLTPIYKSDMQSAGKAKYNVVSLGVSYTFAKVAN